MRDTSRRDLAVVVPAVLVVIALVLMLLLRSVVAPLLLIGANVLSFGATLGVSALVFDHVLDYPGGDPSIPLYAFVFLVALGVGMGESYMWPRLVLLFGPEIRWLFLIGVTLQAVVLLEMARYAMATGESIFTGAARVFKPIMWFFFTIAILIYIWPGHLSAGASAFESATGVPWQVAAIIGMLLVGTVFTLAKVIYDLLEKVLGILIGTLVLGTAVIASIVGTWGDLVTTITGMSWVALSARSASRTAKPSISGIIRSRTTRSGRSRRISSRPARPSCASCRA